MGLDNYWVLAKEEEEGDNQETEPISHFRGRVYNKFLSEVIGYSLYNNLSVNEVKQITKELNNIPLKNINHLAKEYFSDFENPEEVILDLIKMFNFYSGKGASLIASW